MNAECINKVNKAFPIINQTTDEIKNQIFSISIYKKISKNNSILFEGDKCMYLPLVIKGTIRVFKIGENGREITLYRIKEGESCIISATCILNKEYFPALAEADCDVELLLMPSMLFNTLVDKHKEWRSFLFNLYAKRLISVITLLEELKFIRMDIRIARYLLDLFSSSNNINITHNDIAVELSTSREVISRILKKFENDGLIKILRGKIKLINKSDLKEIIKN